MIRPLLEEQSAEVCNRCGHSVAYGKGRFVNRVPDCNDVLTRIQNHWPYPNGDWMCALCDEKSSDDNWESVN